LQQSVHLFDLFWLTLGKSGCSVPGMERGLSWTAVEAAVPTDGGGLRERAAQLAEQYDELVADADAAAVRWRWATPSSGYGDIEPLRLERMGCSPGYWLQRPPPPWREHEAIGYDALGRVVWVREYDSTGEVWLERFATWSRTAVEITCFRAPLECGDEPLPAAMQAITRIRLAGGVPVESERYLPPTGSCTRERYRHEGGRIARVEEDACDDGGGLATVVKEVVYAEDGRVVGVDRVGPQGRQPVWQAAAQDHTTRRGARSTNGRFRRQVCV
jgi:hypothetical protein